MSSLERLPRLATKLNRFVNHENNWRSHEKELPTARSGEMNMSTISVSERIEEASPRIKARSAGVLYLIMIVIGIFDEGRWNTQIAAQRSESVVYE